MSARNDGGPAFPSHGTMGEVVATGMSLRDYFAAKAMQGMLAAFKHWPQEAEVSRVLKLAYQAADEAMKAREV